MVLQASHIVHIAAIILSLEIYAYSCFYYIRNHHTLGFNDYKSDIALAVCYIVIIDNYVIVVIIIYIFHFKLGNEV